LQRIAALLVPRQVAAAMALWHGKLLQRWRCCCNAVVATHCGSSATKCCGGATTLLLQRVAALLVQRVATLLLQCIVSLLLPRRCCCGATGAALMVPRRCC
jgi:hypothetical protein